MCMMTYTKQEVDVIVGQKEKGLFRDVVTFRTFLDLESCQIASFRVICCLEMCSHVDDNLNLISTTVILL